MTPTPPPSTPTHQFISLPCYQINVGLKYIIETVGVNRLEDGIETVDGTCSDKYSFSPVELC